jgi:uncharacterized GH25 family protein
MKRRILMALAIALLMSSAAAAHDLFLKLDTYFLKPNARATVRLLNGTFQQSDGAVARERLRDISLYSPAHNGPIGQSVMWQDQGKTTIMQVQTGGSGTYLVGLSTKPREIDLKAAEFNDYLQHDGLPDTLAARKKDGELQKDVRERYSKHVRAIFQVGDKLSDDYQQLLNYPVEIIPQQNPYSLKVGQDLVVLCLLEGQPIANQFIMAGWESPDGKLHTLDIRSDPDGLARINLKSTGKWYIKFIHMTPLSGQDLNYESKWASLTFEVKGNRRG